VIERHVSTPSRRARVLTGGRRNPACPGFFYEPVVLVAENHDIAIMH
jgi:hypothetical protein